MSKKKDFMENLRTKTIGELEAMLVEKQEELAQETLNVRAAQNKNIREPGNIRTKIAQINTVINELSRKEEETQQE